jgi:hypothetical protein
MHRFCITVPDNLLALQRFCGAGLSACRRAFARRSGAKPDRDLPSTVAVGGTASRSEGQSGGAANKPLAPRQSPNPLRLASAGPKPGGSLEGLSPQIGAQQEAYE